MFLISKNPTKFLLGISYWNTDTLFPKAENPKKINSNNISFFNRKFINY